MELDELLLALLLNVFILLSNIKLERFWSVKEKEDYIYLKDNESN